MGYIKFERVAHNIWEVTLANLASFIGKGLGSKKGYPLFPKRLFKSSTWYLYQKPGEAECEARGKPFKFDGVVGD